MSNYALIAIGIGCVLFGALLAVTYWAMFTILLALVGVVISGIEWHRHRGGRRKCRVGQFAAVVMFANLALFVLITTMFGQSR